MRRDVDFAKLRALPGRRLIATQPGQRVLRFGDPPAGLYVIVSGGIRLSRATDTLAELGPTEIFGEVALLSGSPQPYDATATGATTLIELPSETLLGAIAEGGKLALGLAQTLADRAASLASGIASSGKAAPPSTPKAITAAPFGPTPPVPPAEDDLGLELPVPPWEQAKQAAAEAPKIDKSIPRPEAFWKRTVKCPICGTTFGATQVRPEFIEVASRDSDLYEHHRGINTLWYGIYVCPKCSYAAFPDDFERITSSEATAIRAALEKARTRIGDVDFTGVREPRHARLSFELALLCYGSRIPQLRKVASLYHRLAWLARGAGQAEQEKAYLATARSGYMSAIEKGAVDDARGELIVTYLIADISRRLGDLAEASRWASIALQHPHLDKHKVIADHARQLRQELRSARGEG